MYAPLSDVVTCPRCGPGYGLILLADRVEDRRVHEGTLGCANCRERYGVSRGYALLRYPPREAGEVAGAAPPEDAMRLAALLGVTEGPALLLVVGGAAAAAAAIADLVPGVEVVAVSSALAGAAERPGVSRFATVAQALPFRSGSMRGVVIEDPALIGEAARVAAARARVVMLSAGEGELPAIQQSGLRVVARDARVIVAERVVI